VDKLDRQQSRNQNTAPKNTEAATNTPPTAVSFSVAFKEAMSNAGIEPPEIIEDGELHRFTAPGDRAKSNNSWYVFYRGNPAAGAYGCWKRNINVSWCSAELHTFTAAEKKEYADRMNRIRKQREDEQNRVYAECREISADIWSKGNNVDAKHPYLAKKGIRAVGIKQYNEMLLVPVEDQDGTLHGLQFITSDGAKRFKTGTHKAGHFFKIGKNKNNTIKILCEGYATGASIHEATGHDVVIAFDAGNLLSVAQGIRAKYPDAKIIIAADNDQWTEGNPGVSKATEAARKVGALLAIPAFKNPDARPTDFNDLHCAEGIEAVIRFISSAMEPSPETKATEQVEKDAQQLPRIKVVSVAEFLRMEFPPREYLLSPILPTQGLAMIHAFRGVGKTHVALGIGVAAASAGYFFRWKAEKPRGVLFLDGEMPAVAIKERLSHSIVNAEKELSAPLYIVTPDLQEHGIMPNLSTLEGQLALEPYLKDVDLVIVDNISTLCREGRENEAESWIPVQGWALRLRAMGKSVVFVHHEGRSGNQRGTTKREDVLDTVIRLKRPADYSPEEGARFEVHYEKLRGVYGEDAKPFEARLINGQDGAQSWVTKDLEQSLTERVADLLNDGIPQHEIPEMLGVSKGTVSKHKKKAQGQGLLKESSS